MYTLNHCSCSGSGHRLPRRNLGLGPRKSQHAAAHNRPSNARVVGLEGSSALGIVGDGLGGLKVAGTRGQQSILGRGLIDDIADPRVPSGLNLGGVVVVLGVLDPARSEGQFLVVLKVLVARAIGTDETTVLGVT